MKKEFCGEQLSCSKCKGNKKCKEYAAWNENKSYSGTEEWMTPKHWKDKDAR